MNAFFQRLFSRILPITLMAVGFTLLVKLANIIDGTEQYSQRLLVSEVIAEETSEETTDAEEAEATEEVAEGEEGEEAEKPKKSSRYAKDQAPNFSFTKPKVPEAQRFTDAELELLQSLSERREELEKRTKEVELQESLLQATEKRIDAKLGEMKTLKSEVERILAEYRKQEDKKIKRLVKVYESMKPKEAAEIFEVMDIDTLLLVIDSMNERRAASVLANMSPKKAMNLTVELTEYRKLSAVSENETKVAR